MASQSKRPIHSFSTNFFGVVGYIGSSLVWLLVIFCGLFFLPAGVDSVSVTTFSESSSHSSYTEMSAPLRLLLVVLVFIVFWAFAYVASRVLSRVVKRITRTLGWKMNVLTLIRTKYIIHALGLLLLVALLMAAPMVIWIKIAVAMLGFLGGTIGVASISLQQLLAKRHRISATHLL